MKKSHRRNSCIFTSRKAIALSLPLVFTTDRLVAQGLPVENASPIPVALLFVGAFVLGGFLVYGILRNRTRTPMEKELSDRATRQNYAAEDREARRVTPEKLK